jgi:hypothetical protein
MYPSPHRGCDVPNRRILVEIRPKVKNGGPLWYYRPGNFGMEIGGDWLEEP